jgi:hypothetical protein
LNVKVRCWKKRWKSWWEIMKALILIKVRWCKLWRRWSEAGKGVATTFLLDFNEIILLWMHKYLRWFGSLLAPHLSLIVIHITKYKRKRIQKAKCICFKIWTKNILLFSFILLKIYYKTNIIHFIGAMAQMRLHEFRISTHFYLKIIKRIRIHINLEVPSLTISISTL